MYDNNSRRSVQSFAKYSYKNPVHTQIVFVFPKRARNALTRFNVISNYKMVRHLIDLAQIYNHDRNHLIFLLIFHQCISRHI